MNQPMHKTWTQRLLTAALAATTVLGTAQARTALTPSPVREGASLNLSAGGYHLVNEKRTVGLLKGTNLVSFSWKNVSIDDGSLILTPLDHQNDVRLIGLTYPPGESGAVLAEIYADKDTVATFRVSYLLQNIQRDISYTGTVTNDGKNWRLQREGTVFNRSGERFSHVKVDMGDGLGYEGALDYPEGRKVSKETPNAQNIDKLYRVRLRAMETVGGAPKPLNPDLLYRLKNDDRVSPGKAVLSPGKIRLFQNDKQGTQAFTGEARVRTLAYGETDELNVGSAQDIRVKWFLEKEEDRNVVKAHYSSREPEDDFVVQADRYMKYRLELKNFKEEDATLWINIPAQYSTGVKVLKSEFPTEIERNHNDGVTVKIKVPAGGKEIKTTVELVYPNYIFQTR